MTTKPVDQAIADLDVWIRQIADHAANDRNGIRVSHEVGIVLENMAAIAKAPLTPDLRRDYCKAGVRLAEVVLPLSDAGSRRSWIAWRDRHLAGLAE